MPTTTSPWLLPTQLTATFRVAARRSLTASTHFAQTFFFGAAAPHHHHRSSTRLLDPGTTNPLATEEDYADLRARMTLRGEGEGGRWMRAEYDDDDGGEDDEDEDEDDWVEVDGKEVRGEFGGDEDEGWWRRRSGEMEFRRGRAVWV